MTIKELRDFLKQFPDDAEVWILEGSGYYVTQNPATEINYRDGIVYFGS